MKKASSNLHITAYSFKVQYFLLQKLMNCCNKNRVWSRICFRSFWPDYARFLFVNKTKINAHVVMSLRARLHCTLCNKACLYLWLTMLSVIETAFSLLLNQHLVLFFFSTKKWQWNSEWKEITFLVTIDIPNALLLAVRFVQVQIWEIRKNIHFELTHVFRRQDLNFNLYSILKSSN